MAYRDSTAKKIRLARERAEAEGRLMTAGFRPLFGTYTEMVRIALAGRGHNPTLTVPERRDVEVWYSLSRSADDCASQIIENRRSDAPHARSDAFWP